MYKPAVLMIVATLLFGAPSYSLADKPEPRPIVVEQAPETAVEQAPANYYDNQPPRVVYDSGSSYVVSRRYDPSPYTNAWYGGYTYRPSYHYRPSYYYRSSCYPSYSRVYDHRSRGHGYSHYRRHGSRYGVGFHYGDYGRHHRSGIRVNVGWGHHW